jgi:hypothetical protein
MEKKNQNIFQKMEKNHHKKIFVYSKETFISLCIIHVLFLLLIAPFVVFHLAMDKLFLCFLHIHKKIQYYVEGNIIP